MWVIPNSSFPNFSKVSERAWKHLLSAALPLRGHRGQLGCASASQQLVRSVTVDSHQLSGASSRDPAWTSGIPERAAGFRCGSRRDLPGCEAEACFSSLSQALSAAGAAAVNNNPVLDLQAAQPTASDCFLSLEVEALPHMNPIRRLMKRCTRCPKVGRPVACFHMILIFKVRVGH